MPFLTESSYSPSLLNFPHSPPLLHPHIPFLTVPSSPYPHPFPHSTLLSIPTSLSSQYPPLHPHLPFLTVPSSSPCPHLFPHSPILLSFPASLSSQSPPHLPLCFTFLTAHSSLPASLSSQSLPLIIFAKRSEHVAVSTWN